jgi:hypothetical protein
MIKKGILITSIIELAFLILWNISDFFEIQSVGKGIIIALAIITWLVLLVMVFKDVNKNHNKGMWIALTFVFGGIGGIIYATSVEDNEIKPEEMAQQKKHSMKGAGIFNFFLAGLALVVSIILMLGGALKGALILLAIAVGFFSLGLYLWRR